MDTIKIDYRVTILDYGETYLQLKTIAHYSYEGSLGALDGVEFLLTPLNPFSSLDKYQQAAQVLEEKGEGIKEELRRRVRQQVLYGLSPKVDSETFYNFAKEGFIGKTELIQI